MGAGTPAEAAGATANSLVVEIDGANAERMSHEQLVAALKASGERLVLTLATSYNTAAGAAAPGDNEGLPDYLPKRVEAGAIIASITPARASTAVSRLGLGGTAATPAAAFSPISAMKALPETPASPEVSPERPTGAGAGAGGGGGDGVSGSGGDVNTPDRPTLLPTTLFATVGNSPSKCG